MRDGAQVPQVLGERRLRCMCARKMCIGRLQVAARQRTVAEPRLRTVALSTGKCATIQRFGGVQSTLVAGADGSFFRPLGIDLGGWANLQMLIANDPEQVAGQVEVGR